MSPYTVATQSGFKNGFLSTGTLCDSTNHFPCLFSQNEVQGFFSIKLRKDLLLVGLNTVIFSDYSNANPQRVKVQMNYLETQLDKANMKGMSVLIAMHIPVGKNVFDGTNFWKTPYQDTFLVAPLSARGSPKMCVREPNNTNSNTEIVNIS